MRELLNVSIQIVKKQIQRTLFLDRPHHPILLKGGNFKGGILSNLFELFLYCLSSSKIVVFQCDLDYFDVMFLFMNFI